LTLSTCLLAVSKFFGRKRRCLAPPFFMKNSAAFVIVTFTLLFEFFLSVDLCFNVDSRFDPLKNTDSFRYLILPVLCFFFLLVLFELLIAFICWLAVGSRKGDMSRLVLFVCYYLLVKFSLIAYSSLVFPYSPVGRLLDLSPSLAYVLFGLAALITLMGAFSAIRIVVSLHLRGILVCGVALVSLPILAASFHSANEEYKGEGRKNIILLGVDSVSPRHFHNERDFSNVMPVLHHYFNGGMVYENAYTPLARTYPAWTSILTGLLPRDSEVTFNLVEAASDVKDLSLPAVLDGYYSIYAIDERRFSMVGKDWGFDEVIGPDAGAADFFIDKFRTLASVNFIHSIPGLSDLLPFINNNRAYDDIYMPERFSQSVGNAIERVNGRPLFFALHLCLAHYPYNVSDFSRADGGSHWHKALLGRLDQQFSEVMNSLHASGALDNAIVIIFSDHGESLKANDKSNHVFADVDGTDVGEEIWFTSSGHGSSLLRQDQTEVLLSVSVFEDGEVVNKGADSNLATLPDIYPTIFEYLDKPLPSKYSKFCGQLCKLGLGSVALNALEDTSSRWIFMETGLSFSFLSGVVDLSSKELEEVLSDIAVESYEIGDDGKFAVMKSEWVRKFEKSKSFAFLSRYHFIYFGNDFDTVYVLDRGKRILNRCDSATECEGYGVKREFSEFISTLRE